MQNLDLNYYQRIILWTILGSHQVTTLKDASVYLRLIEKIRLNDGEMLASQFVQDQGRMSWSLPVAGYGDRTVELETDEAKALVAAMEAPSPGLKVNDAGWMLKMVEDLNAQPQAAQAA
jgi:hypothetical protein